MSKLLMIAAVAAVLSVSASYAQEQKKDENAQAETKPKRRITYNAPDRGAPVTRTGGGTRGQGLSKTSIDLIAPQQTGLTSLEQPTLLYFLSAATDKPIILTITDAKSRETILEHADKSPKSAGIHALDLSKTQAKLQSGREYKLVAVVEEFANDDSQNSNSLARLKRVTPEKSPTINATDAAEAAAAYAELGLWFDAQAKLHQAILASPNDKSLRQTRAELLSQENLKAAAELEGAAAR